MLLLGLICKYKKGFQIMVMYCTIIILRRNVSRLISSTSNRNHKLYKFSVNDIYLLYNYYQVHVVIIIDDKLVTNIKIEEVMEMNC